MIFLSRKNFSAFGSKFRKNRTVAQEKNSVFPLFHRVLNMNRAKYNTNSIFRALKSELLDLTASFCDTAPFFKIFSKVSGKFYNFQVFIRSCVRKLRLFYTGEPVVIRNFPSQHPNRLWRPFLSCCPRRCNTPHFLLHLVNIAEKPSALDSHGEICSAAP